MLNTKATGQEAMDPRLERGREEPGTVEPPSMEEVTTAVNRLKNNKAPGIDNIPGELLKYGEDQMIATLHELVNKIWMTETLPAEWQTSVICPIHKKGNKLTCEIYRGISLLSTAYRIFTAVIRKAKLESYTENTLGEYQAGFRPGRSTMDQLYTVKMVAEKCWEFDIDVYQLFVDFKQAYDSIDRSKLYTIMLDFDVPSKLVRLVRVTMQGSQCQVRVMGELTGNFEVMQGLKQGDGLAPTLFNLALEKVIRGTSVDVNTTILQKSQQITGYADEIDILGRSIPAVKEAFGNLENAAKEVGLNVNENKTAATNQKAKDQTGTEHHL